MNNVNMIEKTIEAIVILNAALTNIRLYPPSSAMIVNSIDSVYSIFEQLFEGHDSIVFAESGRSLIISGQALDEKEQKKPQVAAIIQLMLNFGIKSIAFEKGLEKPEIIGFLEVLSKKSDDIRKQGGLDKVLSAKSVKNILLDKKLYVAMDKDQRIVSAGEINDMEKNAGKVKGSVSDERRSGEDRRRNDDMEYLAKGGIERRNKEQREKQLNHIKDGINSIIKGDNKALVDRQVMQALAPTVLDLMTQGKDKVVKTIINRLGEGLLNQDERVRAETAATLTRIGFKLISDKRFDEMNDISQKLVKWIEFETTAPPAYRYVCDQLRALSKYLISRQRFEEAGEIISPFYMIRTGELKKIEPIQGQSGIVLEGVATERILEMLKEGAQAGETGGRDHAAELLKMLGAYSGIPKQESPVAVEGHAEKDEAGSLEEEPGDDEYSSQMRVLDQHLEKNDTTSAVKLLFDMIVKYAEEKDFEKAESLRERLMEVSPMALTEIVKSGEIIDEAKSGAIDQGHLDRWANLYQNFTQEETSTLYFAMKPARFKAGEVVFKQGDRDSRLYFINKGKLKMLFSQGDQKKTIKELNPGDIVGDEAFFNLTVCTSTVTASSDVDLNFLEKDILAKWEKAGLGIGSKLLDYTLKQKKTWEFLCEQSMDRRSEERIEISVKVSIQSLDQSGSPAGKPVTGTLADICPEGASFYLKIPKENVLKIFEAQRINLKFNISSGDASLNVDQNGTVVAAMHHFYDYSIHVKFDKSLGKEIFEEIGKASVSREGELEVFSDL